jgi:acetyl-CoA carboxylase biotin carboxyl carrier protein
VAPLTGVFYPAPSPSSPPYVQIGDAVQAGQIVCIVEAMKVFNEITAEIAGTVKSVQAQSGQLVHAGEALIRVQPA